jgi:YidC/Oxa1 family membrane protein insertase
MTAPRRAIIDLQPTTPSSDAKGETSDSLLSSGIETITAPNPQQIEEFETIETDLVKVVFTTKGGDIASYQLKGHLDNGKPVEMAGNGASGSRAFSLLLGNASGTPVDQFFTAKRISETEIGFFTPMIVKGADGSERRFTLVKHYRFVPNEYLFELKVTIDGDAGFSGLSFGDAGYTLVTSPKIGPDWNAKQDKYEYRKFFHLINGKKKTTQLNAGQTKDISDKFSWTAVAGKYFTLIALPENFMQGVRYAAPVDSEGKADSQLRIIRGPIEGARNTDIWRFYIGPRTDKELARYNVAANNAFKVSDAQLNEMVESSGILTPLESLLKLLMELFYKVIPNWGISIILMTILMRIVIFPLTKKSSEATHKMQEHAPKMQEIQEKYRGNPQKLNEELAKFYKESGYNPLSGCLPLLIQFPLIFAMYNLFNNYFEFRGAMFIPGWIPDLSRGDSVLAFPFTLPLVGWSELRILPIVYVVSQLFFGKVTQTPTGNQQNGSMKMMMYGMPLVFFFLFYNAPAGLLLYWTFSNILTLGQQILINRMMESKKKAVMA